MYITENEKTPAGQQGVLYNHNSHISEVAYKKQPVNGFKQHIHLTWEDVLAETGIPLPDKPISDTNFTRWGKNQRYYALAIGDGYAFGDWVRDLRETWFPRKWEALSPSERAQRKVQIRLAEKRLEKEKKLRQAEAAKRAAKLWEGAKPIASSTPHPYLQRKQVEAFGIRERFGSLLVPLYDIEGQLWSLQFINPKGGKWFLRDGRIGGCFFIIGEIIPDKPFYVVEGFATGASIYQATGAPVIVAFNAGNLEAVIVALRKKYPGCMITICGDEDQWPDEHGKVHNTGRKKAEEAAVKHGCNVVFPVFSETLIERLKEKGEKLPTDFNDLLLWENMETVCKQLVSAVIPAQKEKKKASALQEAGTASNQCQRIIDIAENALELWHDEHMQAGISVWRDTHVEHYLIGSSNFKNWLYHIYYRLYHRPPKAQFYHDALPLLEAICRNDGERYHTWTRVGEVNGKRYIDLANEDWQVVEIDADGWRIVNPVEVKYLRTSRMQALPVPQPGGHIDMLKPFINYGSEEQFILLVGFILKCLDAHYPYPILTLIAEQGSGKTEACAMIAALVDPSTVSLRSKPRNEDDLLVMAKHNQLLIFDNLSGINGDQSDWLCRLSTGAGLGKRKLYTDDEESAVSVSRPVILNSIHEISERADLLDRAIVLTLPPIPEEKRRDKKQLWEEFEAARPQLLGVLCEALVKMQRNCDPVMLSRKPRMLDFAQFVTAAEPAFGWVKETFLKAYMGNIEEASRTSLEMNPLACALLAYMQTIKEEATDTPADWLTRLKRTAERDGMKPEYFPRTPNVFSRELQRLIPPLRREGIIVTVRKSNGQRLISIAWSSKASPKIVPFVPVSEATADFQDFDRVDSRDDLAATAHYRDDLVYALEGASVLPGTMP
jgi:phage/plasmid primase-like uncharacterized protein